MGWNKWLTWSNLTPITQIKSKATMLKSNLWYYIDGHILVKETVSIANMGGTATVANNDQKK